MSDSLFKDRKPVEGSSFTSQFITYGIKSLKVNKIETTPSKKSPNRVQHVFYVEGPSLGESFKGYKDDSGYEAKGLIGRVKLGQYFDPNSKEEYDLRQKESFLDDISLMVSKAETSEKLAELTAATPWDKVLKTIEKALKDVYLWYVIAGEEYQKGRFNLSFATVPVGKDDDGKYTFRIIVKESKFYKSFTRDEKGIIVEVKGENTLGENKGTKVTIKFDPTYHLKPFEPGDSDGGLNLKVEDDDLPF